MNVKDKIRGYRTMLGLNQYEMGKGLGISKQSYYNKENGNPLKPLILLTLLVLC